MCVRENGFAIFKAINLQHTNTLIFFSSFLHIFPYYKHMLYQYLRMVTYILQYILTTFTYRDHDFRIRQKKRMKSMERKRKIFLQYNFGFCLHLRTIL